MKGEQKRVTTAQQVFLNTINVREYYKWHDTGTTFIPFQQVTEKKDDWLKEKFPVLPQREGISAYEVRWMPMTTGMLQKKYPMRYVERILEWGIWSPMLVAVNYDSHELFIYKNNMWRSFELEMALEASKTEKEQRILDLLKSWKDW